METVYLPLVGNDFEVAGEEEMKPIIDISYWQQPNLIDYDKLADSISGAILRGAYGIWKDTAFETHYAELHKRGVPLGSYHYIIGSQTGTAQADIFNQVVKGKDLKLGLWDDVEDRRVITGLTKSVVHSAVNKKQERIDSAMRNAIEGSFGTGKRRYGLNRIMSKLKETSETSINLIILLMNLEKLLKDVFVNFFWWYILLLKRVFCIKLQVS